MGSSPQGINILGRWAGGCRTLKITNTGASITGPSENCGSEELGLYKFMWS